MSETYYERISIRPEQTAGVAHPLPADTGYLPLASDLGVEGVVVLWRRSDGRVYVGPRPVREVDARHWAVALASRDVRGQTRKPRPVTRWPASVGRRPAP